MLLLSLKIFWPLTIELNQPNIARTDTPQAIAISATPMSQGLGVESETRSKTVEITKPAFRKIYSYRSQQASETIKMNTSVKIINSKKSGKKNMRLQKRQLTFDQKNSLKELYIMKTQISCQKMRQLREIKKQQKMYYLWINIHGTQYQRR